MQLAQFFSQIWQKKDINLLPRSDFDNSVWGQILNWAINVGKWIVIGVELIVICVFLIRLSLDRKRVSLQKKVQQQIAQIKAYEDFENEFKLLQVRANFANQVITEEDRKEKTFKVLSQLIPDGVWVEKVTISENGLDLSAYADSLYGFGKFISNINNNKQFSKVVIDNIKSANTTTARLQFNLSLKGKNK